MNSAGIPPESLQFFLFKGHQNVIDDGDAAAADGHPFGVRIAGGIEFNDDRYDGSSRKSRRWFSVPDWGQD